MPTCVFCGFTGKLTGEHVFGTGSRGSASTWNPWPTAPDR